MGPAKRKDLPQRRLASLPSQVLLSQGTGLLQIAAERPPWETQLKPLQIDPGRLQASGEDHGEQGDAGVGGQGVRCEAASRGVDWQEE